ncbi:MAG: YqaA family protein [Legionella sp.]
MGVIAIFSSIYDKTLLWSNHRHAHYYLAGVSFAESSFFPIPPDIMLISMGLACPNRSWQYAWIATLFSVMGGIVGYIIGYYCMAILLPYILSSSYATSYEHMLTWFKDGGLWMVMIAGFTPVPYKLFTLTAGAMHLQWTPFVIGSILGRGLRFFLVSALLFFLGETLQQRLRPCIDLLGWSILIIVVLMYLLIKFVS